MLINYLPSILILLKNIKTKEKKYFKTPVNKCMNLYRNPLRLSFMYYVFFYLIRIFIHNFVLCINQFRYDSY